MVPKQVVLKAEGAKGNWYQEANDTKGKITKKNKGTKYAKRIKDAKIKKNIVTILMII